MREEQAQEMWSRNTRFLRIISAVFGLVMMGLGVANALLLMLAAQGSEGWQAFVNYLAIATTFAANISIGLLVIAAGQCLSSVVEVNWYQLQTMKKFIGIADIGSGQSASEGDS